MFTTVLSKTAETALALLGKSRILPEKTYLAGGSALALHYSLIKGLSYFDAEDSEIPEMIAKVDWEEVKKFLQNEVVRLANKYI